MPRMSKADAAVSLDEPEIEGRYAELGEYTVAFETHKADMDPAVLFRGLPDDRCPCPHWGVVLAGRIVFRYADHDEVYTTGRLLWRARAPAAPVRRDRARRVQPDRPAERGDGRHRQEPRGGAGGRPGGRCLIWLCLTWTWPSCVISARS